jgi:hypothetical protein
MEKSSAKQTAKPAGLRKRGAFFANLHGVFVVAIGVSKA